MRETKTFALDAADFKMTDSGAGGFTGRASTFNSLDSYGDKVAPGAYAKTLDQFKTHGFIAWSHDWTNPIAMVGDAYEKEDGLWVEAKFHSDPAAQTYRTRVKERIDAGQFMGLSIGYKTDKWHMEDETRILDEITLYEVSLVSVPAEPKAGLTMVKGFDLEFEEHFEQVRAALSEFVARCKAGSAARVKDGRALSEARRSLIESISGSLRTHAGDLDALLADPDEEPQEDPVVGLAEPATDELKRLAASFLRLESIYGSK